MSATATAAAPVRLVRPDGLSSYRTATGAMVAEWAEPLAPHLRRSLAAHRTLSVEGRAHMVSVLAANLPDYLADADIELWATDDARLVIEFTFAAGLGVASTDAALRDLGVILPTLVGYDPLEGLRPLFDVTLSRMSAERPHANSLTRDEVWDAVALMLVGDGRDMVDAVLEDHLIEAVSNPDTDGFVRPTDLTFIDLPFEDVMDANKRLSWIPFVGELADDWEAGYFNPMDTRTNPETGQEEVLVGQHTYSRSPNSSCHVCGLMPQDWDSLETVCVARRTPQGPMYW